MARVNLEEKKSDHSDELEAELKKIKKAARSVRPKKKFNCCLITLLLVIFAVLLAVAVVAKSGIAGVPVFSSIFYRLPQPTRQIVIEDMANFKAEGFKVGGSPDEGIIIFEVPEKELTYILRLGLTGKKDSYFASNLQTVVTDGQIELFGLLLKPVTANLTVKFKPILNNNALETKITQFKVGQLSLPPVLVNWLYRTFYESRGKAANKALMEKIKIQKFDVTEGKITVVAGMDINSLLEGLKKINPNPLNQKAP